MADIKNSQGVGAGSTIQELCSNITNIANNKGSADDQTPAVLDGTSVAILFIVMAILLLLFFSVLLAYSSNMDDKSTILRRLRATPASELHRKVEEEYNMHFKHNEDAKDIDWTGEARYPIVTFHDDVVNMKRTVTVVEDLKVYAYRMPEHSEGAFQRRRGSPETQRAAREDEVARLLAFSDRCEPAEHARAISGRPQMSAAPRTDEQNGDIDSQDLMPPPYPLRAK